MFVDKCFRNCSKDKPYKTIYRYSDIFQMRSKVVYFRTCPLVHYFLEGASKTVLLVLVSHLLIDVYDNASSRLQYAKQLEAAIIVIATGSVLRELGEVWSNEWWEHEDSRTSAKTKVEVEGKVTGRPAYLSQIKRVYNRLYVTASSALKYLLTFVTATVLHMTVCMT